MIMKPMLLALGMLLAQACRCGDSPLPLSQHEICEQVVDACERCLNAPKGLQRGLECERMRRLVYRCAHKGHDFDDVVRW